MESLAIAMWTAPSQRAGDAFYSENWKYPGTEKIKMLLNTIYNWSKTINYTLPDNQLSLLPVSLPYDCSLAVVFTILGRHWILDNSLMLWLCYFTHRFVHWLYALLRVLTEFGEYTWEVVSPSSNFIFCLYWGISLHSLLPKLLCCFRQSWEEWKKFYSRFNFRIADARQVVDGFEGLPTDRQSEVLKRVARGCELGISRYITYAK